MRERERERGIGERERERERERLRENPKQVLHGQHRPNMGPNLMNPRDHDLSRNQKLDA